MVPLVDPRAHKLVPNHRLMTNAQKERLIKSMRLQNKTLPKIRIDDPVISAMIEGGQEISLGDMIEIERDSLTFGKSLYYREVIQ